MTPATSTASQSTGSPFTVRIAKKSDEALIFNSWLRSYRTQNSRMSRAPRDMYFRDQHRRIEEMLSAAKSYVLVLSATEEPDAILGWLCGTDAYRPGLSVVQFAYTKASYRRRGVLSRLLYAADVASPLAYTHQTRSGSAVANALRGKGWTVDLVTPEELPQ